MLGFQGLYLIVKVHERILLTHMYVTDLFRWFYYFQATIGLYPNQFQKSTVGNPTITAPKTQLSDKIMLSILSIIRMMSGIVWYTCHKFGMVLFSGDTGFVMEDTEDQKVRLTELKNEHRDLDEIIHDLVSAGPYDQIKLQRLKKRKLQLKDQISRIEDGLLPDIIA